MPEYETLEANVENELLVIYKRFQGRSAKTQIWPARQQTFMVISWIANIRWSFLGHVYFSPETPRRLNKSRATSTF